MNSSKRPSVCFVTNELYPLGPGGIGRMLYNFAQHNAELGLPADFHFLVPQTLLDARPNARDLLEAAFEGIATIHVCQHLAGIPTQMAQVLARAQEHPWTTEWLYASSYSYYLGLLAAEERLGKPFDVIEFPDFGGWAQASIEAKRSGLSFQDSLISARIHSTQGMLFGMERYINDPGHWAGIMFDAERHLLAHADLIVAHDPEVTARTARFYGLAARWEGRSRLEFPPVYVNLGEGVYERADKLVPKRDPEPCQDFLFGSRLQPIKRPDLFIRAAILFLERHPDHAGAFRLVCSGWDRTFVDGLKSLVPEQMSEQILFFENAEERERLDWINKSIVVVPSDYESLCLFAFEAALVGRKTILNAVCPAFGNGFRWHDGKNCLLFDGSVESLTDTMERALKWEPVEQVTAAPDRPYWLGELVELPARKPGIAAASVSAVDIAILCFGAQSQVEFHRHFDAACRLEDELKSAGTQHRFVFQLPSGAFDREGAECELIRQRGWSIAFSSGLRECPQMFGKRIASLGAQAVLMFPFGHEMVPGFAAAACDIMRSDPSLSIVAGHLEVIDGGTGRSDYIRIYSGEAPSTALLASRAAPPMCLLNVEVLQRVQFDPWSGPDWFEVFARRCALGSEGIVIMPILAGTMDALLLHRPETSKRVAAGLLDQLGIASGWQARLLSVDPAQVPSDVEGRPFSYGEDRMRQTFRINPSGRPRPWEPVGWQDSADGVLVHPLDGEITIGELAGPHRRVSKLVAQVRNVQFDNAGAEVAIALARSQADVQDVLRAAEQGVQTDLIAISGWTVLEPGATAQLMLACYSTSRGHDKVLLLSRPRAGCSDSNTEIVFTSIETHFNNLSIG